VDTGDIKQVYNNTSNKLRRLCEFVDIDYDSPVGKRFEAGDVVEYREIDAEILKISNGYVRLQTVKIPGPAYEADTEDNTSRFTVRVDDLIDYYNKMGITNE
jgi:hypothetical protein